MSGQQMVGAPQSSKTGGISVEQIVHFLTEELPQVKVKDFLKKLEKDVHGEVPAAVFWLEW